MKKALSILLITGMFFTATTEAVFASGSNSKLETSFPYVEELGYEVNLDVKEQEEETELSYI
ncbi:hypothetical protein [Anaerococcus provencensis]|uniref:hypothetical protein n=1 Tax=Anaerococcus provencensis TaxID=938293 RepID=UPI0002F9C894|nr:hypothetical protein [Anaerococcus provencensis]